MRGYDEKGRNGDGGAVAKEKSETKIPQRVRWGERGQPQVDASDRLSRTSSDASGSRPGRSLRLNRLNSYAITSNQLYGKQLPVKGVTSSLRGFHDDHTMKKTH